MPRARRWGHRCAHACPRRYFAVHPLRRAREIRFVAEFFARFAEALPDATRLPKRRHREFILSLALMSLNPAGYEVRIVTDAGTPRKMAVKQADYLLHMPRIQRALDEKFAAAGLTDDKAAAIIAEIAMADAPVAETETYDKDGTLVSVTKHKVAAGDRLRALDMKFRLTTGYAPTRSNSVTTNVPVDAFFDAAEFEETPAIATTHQEPRDVTPRPKKKR